MVKIVAEENTNETQLFDLVIPPGVPRSIIYDIQEKFNFEVVSRRERMQFANMDGDERDLLAFRGKKEIVEQAYDYMMAELEKYVED